MRVGSLRTVRIRSRSGLVELSSTVPRTVMMANDVSDRVHTAVSMEPGMLIATCENGARLVYDGLWHLAGIQEVPVAHRVIRPCAPQPDLALANHSVCLVAFCSWFRGPMRSWP